VVCSASGVGGSQCTMRGGGVSPSVRYTVQQYLPYKLALINNQMYLIR